MVLPIWEGNHLRKIRKEIELCIQFLILLVLTTAHSIFMRLEFNGRLIVILLLIASLLYLLRYGPSFGPNQQ